MAQEKTNGDYSQKRETAPLWKEYVKAGMVALILALVIRTYVAQAFKIPSESMLNTLQVGDHLLVNKLVYHFWAPERGDIIVFEFPGDASRDFVKRIVGLPGEKVELINSDVYIDDKKIDEPYAVYDTSSSFHGVADNFGPVIVPEGHLFMMGDNRWNSQDSRVWGPLDINKIHGKVFVIHWAWEDHTWGVRWNRIGLLFD